MEIVAAPWMWTAEALIYTCHRNSECWCLDNVYITTKDNPRSFVRFLWCDFYANTVSRQQALLQRPIADMEVVGHCAAERHGTQQSLLSDGF